MGPLPDHPAESNPRAGRRRGATERRDKAARRSSARGVVAVLLSPVAVLGMTACGAASALPTTVRAHPQSSATPSTPGPATGIGAPGPGTGIGLPVLGPGPRDSSVVQPQSAPGSCHYRYVGADPLPDPRCTPGAVDPQVTQADITSTICIAGYTSTVRPPESVTEEEKAGSAAAYGYSGSFRTGEYDHLVPLELGGDPNDAANLWVEPNDVPGAATTYNTKDGLEDRLHQLVCSGQLPLSVAQSAIASDWVAALRSYGT